MTITNNQIKVMLAVTLAVADTIRELGRVPSGHLYANLMGQMNFDTYTGIIQLLKDSGVIREEAYELIWVGKPQ